MSGTLAISSCMRCGTARLAALQMVLQPATRVQEAACLSACLGLRWLPTEPRMDLHQAGSWCDHWECCLLAKRKDGCQSLLSNLSDEAFDLITTCCRRGMSISVIRLSRLSRCLKHSSPCCRGCDRWVCHR